VEEQQHLTREEWNDISRRLQEPFDPSDVDEIELRRLMRFVRINPSSGCWDWMGAKTISGYGKVTIWDSQGRHDTLAHRWTWELHNGPIQGAGAIDHLCRNRACCNPPHLELVTYGENNRRAWAARPVQTKCKQGHD
jgi:hypothetical protein